MSSVPCIRCLYGLGSSPVNGNKWFTLIACAICAGAVRGTLCRIKVRHKPNKTREPCYGSAATPLGPNNCQTAKPAKSSRQTDILTSSISPTSDFSRSSIRINFKASHLHDHAFDSFPFLTNLHEKEPPVPLQSPLCLHNRQATTPSVDAVHRCQQQRIPGQ